jgi:phosphoadenosine phosphosulfate reductase
MTCPVVSDAPQLEGKHPADILAWAAERYGDRLTVACSLGVEDCALVDMAAQRGLKLDWFTLDTGLLFPQTYALWKKVEERYGITLRAVKPGQTVDEQAGEHGPRLWERQPDRCCALRKLAPLKAELARFDAWVTAIRREQSKDRANAQVVEQDLKFGLVKVNPLVAWSHKDVWRYVAAHGVPYNPLHDQGYPSIGCQPCTSAVKPGEDPRAGRWRGTEKVECGLHTKDEAP